MVLFYVFILFSLPVRLAASMMGLLLPCVLLLSVFTFAASLDFQQESKPLGQSDFVRRSYIEEKAAKIAKRSLPAWLAASPNHKIKRRSTEQDNSCGALQGYDAKLAENTHSVSYQLQVLLLVTRLTIK